MGEFSYQPLFGPLTGESFEEQTEAFFEKLDQKIKDGLASANLSLDQCRTQTASALAGVADNSAEIAALRALIATQNASVAALLERMRKMEEAALFIYPDVAE